MLWFRSRVGWRRSARAVLRIRTNLPCSCEQLEQRTLLAAAVGFGELSFAADSWATDRILVRFDDTERVDTAELPLAGVKLGPSIGQTGLYEVLLNGEVDPATAVTAFENHANVEYAHPDFTVEITSTPDDPLYDSQWGLDNTGRDFGTLDADIDAPEAWELRNDATDVIVAVIDTGIDYQHPDLVNNIWRNPGEIAGDGIDNDGNGYVDDVHGYDFANDDGDPMDDAGHGTHVAGIIGAEGNNGLGVTGVAWNTQLMAVKFLNARGRGSTSNAIRALDYARTMGADIANNSWGGGQFSQALQDAIDRFHDADGIVTAAAGNSGRNNDSRPFYPASYDNVVAVAASDRRDNRALFSDFGPNTVDLAAPGQSILSTDVGGGYRIQSGTSMAAPFVAGAFALARAESPHLSSDALIDLVLSATDDTLRNVTAAGRLNLVNVLEATAGQPATLNVVSATWGDQSDHVMISFDRAVQADTFTPALVTLTGPEGHISIESVEQADANGTDWIVRFAPQTAAGAYQLQVDPQIRGLADEQLDEDRDGITGETDDAFRAEFVIESSPVLFEWSGGVDIVDADASGPGVVPGRTTVSLIVNDNVTIADLDIEVTLDHTWISDLMIELAAPDGTQVPLFARRGGDGTGLKVRFDDEADRSIAEGQAPFDGAFRPETPLSEFDGRNTAGVWQLSVLDLAPGDVGTIKNVRLLVTPADTTPEPPPPEAEPFAFRPVMVPLTFHAPPSPEAMFAERQPPSTTLVGTSRLAATPSTTPPTTQWRQSLEVASTFDHMLDPDQLTIDSVFASEADKAVPLLMDECSD